MDTTTITTARTNRRGRTLTLTAAVTIGALALGVGVTPVAHALTSGSSPAAAAASMVVLKYGSSGPLVKELQRRLHIAQDGHFGPATLRAVKAFQKSKGLTPDGIVGPATWKALGGYPGSTGGGGGTGGGSGKGKVVHLTFDDGPNGTYTPQVLAVLRKHNAKATFFMLGQNASGSSLVGTVRSQGHAVANHSWNHPQLTRLSRSAIASQLSRTDAALGRKAACVRPPYGATNATVRSVIASRGQKQVLWTVDTNDWRRPGAGVIASRIVAGAKKNGAIILMHDGGGNRSQTVAGLDRALTTLQAQGYRFTPVPGC